ncbi:MAG: hypothetical protein JNN20_18790 [Betaproteobacteria bacterium]|nr:hypothetical protein [Betaproteobacteria bacterium]
MLIGLRLLLMVAVIASAATLLGYLFTRNPRFLQLTKNIVKVTLLIAVAVGVIYVLERLLLA